MIDNPSPNWSLRPSSVSIDCLILHYTGMFDRASALYRLCDHLSEVSCHYVIDEDGHSYRLVDENHQAWHAGISSWRGRKNLNAMSIGIELVNPGHDWGYQPFPEIQMESLRHLCTDLLGRYPIEPENIVGHSDIAPTRKYDPGENFDWAWLARAGIGLWPQIPNLTAMKSLETLDRASMNRCLAQIGYDLGEYDDSIGLEESLNTLEQACIIAFQRRFLPSCLGRSIDPLTNARLVQVAAAFRPPRLEKTS